MTNLIEEDRDDVEARFRNCRGEKQSAFANYPIDLHAGARRVLMSPELYAPSKKG